MLIIQKGFIAKRRWLGACALLLALLLPVEAFCEVQPVAYRRDDTPRNGLVRVCLASLGTPRTLNIRLTAAYRVSDTEIALPAGADVTVSVHASSGQLTLSCAGQNWKLKDSVTLLRSSKQASLRIEQAKNAGEYPADLIVSVVKDGDRYALETVAYIQLEDYLYGVLSYAIAKSAPAEALKAQAIITRTYTARAMDEHTNAAYDVVDTGADQIYRGTPEADENLRLALDATKGFVLRYGEDYAYTYYSFSNGGQTESVQNAWNGENQPYLIVQDDPFDLASKMTLDKTFRIEKDLMHGNVPDALMELISRRAVEKLLAEGYAATTENTSLIWLESIKLHTPRFAAPSKLYTKADFSLMTETVSAGGNRQVAPLTVTLDVFEELESMLDLSLHSDPNELWSVSGDDESFTIRAARYGHGVGLSQYGAAEMAEQGYACEYILGFYYPGCTNVRMAFAEKTLREALNTVPINATSAPLDGEAGISTTIPPLTTPLATETEEPAEPTVTPTIAPTAVPTAEPTAEPTVEPTEAPTAEPTAVPTQEPTPQPTAEPTARPGAETTPEPTPLQTVTPAPEAPAEPDYYASVTAEDYVNLRYGPSLEQEVIGIALHGEIVHVLAVRGEWAHVEYNGLRAYALRALLSDVFPLDDECSTPAYEEEVLQPADQWAEESTIILAHVYAERGTVNFREEPSMNAPILMRLPIGARVVVDDVVGDFCSVLYSGVSGYIMTDFLRFDQSVPVQQTPEPTLQPTPAPTVAPTPAFDAVPVGDCGSMAAASGSEAGYRNARVITSGGGLNLRESPYDNARVLYRIPQCAIVEARELDEKWSAVRYSGISGYAKNSFLSFAENYATEVLNTQMTIRLPEYSIGPATVCTPSGSLNLRALPCPYSAVLALVPKGETVEVYTAEEGWALVSYREHVGYVSLDYLQMQQEEITDPSRTAEPDPDAATVGSSGRRFRF